MWYCISVRGLLVAFALLFVISIEAAAQSQTPGPASFLRAHHLVSTEIADAQVAFDDGLTLLYAYNPEAARVAFEKAAAADPHLAIAWWGVAMSYGPNINTDFDTANAKRGHDAIERATKLQAGASPVEVALIDAADKRFAHFGPSDGDASAKIYRNAMNATAMQFPDDDDVQALTAEAGMDMRPWAYFKDDGTPQAGTQDIISRLQLVLARDPAHIGAEHFLIHAVEESKHPELALDAARRLAAGNFEPGAEHLIHMPAHTFERVGLYHEAGVANARAVDALLAYLAHQPGANHGAYLGHDCLFGVDAFMMSGEYERGHALAQTCEQNDGGKGLIRIVDYRFRRWNALSADGTGAFVTSMFELHDHKTSDPLKQSKQLASQDSRTAQIAAALITAGLAREHNDSAAEITALTHAVSLQDSAGYSEPPAFYFSAREALGSAQLRASRARDAAATFRADLEKYPGNARSLFGLATALDRLGDADGATVARKAYAAAWAHADTQLTLEEL